MGQPAAFVRLSRCIPPFCPWCDTVYAQGPGKPTPVEEIAGQVRELGQPLAVITGGEPYLQWDRGLDRLESEILNLGIRVQYETSGKVPIPESSRGFKVCSPKYLDGRWHFAPENLVRADCFKFVAGDDVSRISAFIASGGIPGHKVWIMPLGADRQTQLDRSQEVWQFCARHGFNFSPRLHTLIFNNRKGV